MAKGIYETLSTIIKLKSEQAPVIDAKKLIYEIDISDEPQEEKDAELMMYRVATALSANGFRSISKGTSIYIDVNKMNNPKVMDIVLDNISKDIEDKERKKEALQKVMDGMPQTENQIFMITNGNEWTLGEEMSIEQIVEALKQIAV